PDEIAPMSLRTYEEVRPWAKAIGRAVHQRDMPPWDADPGFGPFLNDISLSQHEIDTIERWVAAGAPRGDGSEPSAPAPTRTGTWTMGEPDWVIEFDAYEVSADGPDEFLQIPVDLPAGSDGQTWIKAVEVLPGDPKVVHHFILWQADESGRGQESWVAGWAAGAPPAAFPKGTARLIKPGRKLIGDFHYHPYGEKARDKTRVGVYFAQPEDVVKEYVNLWILNASFKIPAGDANYGAKASYVFPQDAEILSLAPHMHYRGKDMKYTAIYPDGRQQELLKVSDYDFNWQTGYDFLEPVAIPAGTKIEVVAHWDNSADNPHNPDPTVDVAWGPESTDEMLIGFVDYVVKEGVSPKPVSLVIGKLAELAEEFPGQVWRVDVEPAPGAGMQPTAVLLPHGGNPGGWYVQMGSLVLPAPIRDVAWDGNKVTATAMIPGQEPMAMEGSVDDSGKLTLSMGGGSVVGTPAEKAAKATTLPNA
ncbi:MAG: hypothetical protein R3190_03395, partial [Thermoanaerobaculia bacterium]|nr:hypothetical protein [Thermoanaerobaculia bacterium]